MEFKGYPVGITGVGYSVPERIVTNKELENLVDTTDEWIQSRTGIKQRHVAAEDKATSDYASEAALKALKHAGVAPEDVDLIIVGTVTPDYPMPATACLVQTKIGAKKAMAFDMAAACTSFIYGLAIGSQFIKTGMYKKVLVIGAETLSRIVDWKDRNTCVLFGDGAGAALLEPVKEGEGLLAFDLGTDGAGAELLYVPAGGSKQPATAETVEQALHTIKMNGKEVFKFAVKVMGESAERALAKVDLNRDDIDFLVPHQANTRIIESAVKKLNIASEKVFVNVDRYGNTSAASVGIALAEAVENGKITEGDIVALVGFGSGLTWGTCVIRWSAKYRGENREEE